ncbi:MAG: terpene cyclase/mutase family protein [Planctomycetia bacterium]|nr:terpene cyclase/mutase family protein [Planctomycetia bacterium]
MAMAPRGGKIAIGFSAGALVVLLQWTALVTPQEDRPSTPESRALAYLSIEVPKWTEEHKCYSCHNNGDAARALMAAMRAGDLMDRKPLEDTLRFLATPERWDENGPDGPFKDKKLARIQFAAALVGANSARVLLNREALEKAASSIAELQRSDGSWETDAPGSIGSPVTYGPFLATYLARRTLAASEAAKYRAAIAKSDEWFEHAPVVGVLDGAATLWALAESTGPAAKDQREQCLKLIRTGQSSEGGWGPFVTSPSEVFDTALVVLALNSQVNQEDLTSMLRRGREYLIATQEPDGGWPATTRPSGADSYAQRLSTAGWATQALLATRATTDQSGN